MIAGVRGRLLSATYAETQLQTLPGAAIPSDTEVHALDLWFDRCESTLGPAASVRAITDVAVVPLLRLLGYELERRRDEGVRTVLHARSLPAAHIPIVVVPWGQPLD